MAEPLKHMVGEDVINEIAARVSAVAPRFDGGSFIEDMTATLPDLELKPRIEAIARGLRSGLDGDYRQALEVIVEVARAEPPIAGFAAWPLCTFVEIFGIADPAASLPAMEHLTKRASCEFAIRPFLRDHWEAAYSQLVEFTEHDEEAVRRLPSEGTRPRLPWGMGVARLIDDPRPGLELLERLRHDPSEVVRRSIANHLNDIAKFDPDLVVATVQRWRREPQTDSKMVSHALRTLVKQGHPGALGTLGYTTAAAVDITAFSVTPATVSMGDRIELTAELRSWSGETQRLVVDFIIHHVTKSGDTSPKVFKWATVELGPGEQTALVKRRLIQMASTRTYYAGRHLVELQIAGKVVAHAGFNVST